MASSSSTEEKSASPSSTTEKSVNFPGQKIKVVIVTTKKKEDLQKKKKIQGKCEDEEKQDAEEEKALLESSSREKFLEEIITEIKTMALDLGLNFEMFQIHDLTALQTMEDIEDLKFVLVENNLSTTETEILKILKNEPQIECTPVVLFSFLKDYPLKKSSWKLFIKERRNLNVSKCTPTIIAELLKECCGGMEKNKGGKDTNEKTDSEGNESSSDDDEFNSDNFDILEGKVVTPKVKRD